jgi:hypothetical protein
MTLRREGKTPTQLLTRRDLAIAKALTASAPTRSTRSAGNTSPKTLFAVEIPTHYGTFLCRQPKVGQTSNNLAIEAVLNWPPS